MGSSPSQAVRSPYEKPESVITEKPPSRKATQIEKSQTSSPDQDNRKEQIHLLKKMFYKLDPAVIKDGLDVNYGQLKLAIKYISDQQLLLVKVLEARCITAKSVRGHLSKPFVKVELVSTKENFESNILESAENEPKYTSSTDQRENLIFNEIFSFNIPQQHFQDVKLRCSVWSSDSLQQDEFFGEVHFDIQQLDCVDAIQVAWHDLQAQTDIKIGGEISLHLGYKLPQSLTVTINSARNITKAVKQDKAVALSVKVVVPGAPQVFHTTPVRGDEEYTWIETFTFPIPREELANRHLILIVSDSREQDSYLGECHISLETIDLIRGYEGVFQLSDMRGSNVVRSRWSQNAVTQELQEAFYAHSMYMRPQFLFDRSSPKTKAVSVNVPKAFVHSHVRVVNGVVVQ